MKSHAQNGSILLEAIIALGITSFLIFSATQITRSTLRSLKDVTTLSASSSKIIMVTSQLEKDLASLVSTPPPTKDVGKDAPGNDKDKKDDTDPKQQKSVSRTLIAQADNKAPTVMGKKELLTLKILNGITTSSLQSYGENKPQFVRFCYKLIKQNLPAPHQKKTAFKLYRRETTALDDLNIKQEADLAREDLEKNSDWILICDNISNCFIEFSTLSLTTTLPRQSDYAKATTDRGSDSVRQSSERATGEGQATTNQQSDSKKQPDKPEIVTSFEWPNPKLPQEFQEQLPRFITLSLHLWDEHFEKTTTYERLITCLNQSGTLPDYASLHKIALSGGKPPAPQKASVTPPSPPPVTAAATKTTPPPPPPPSVSSGPSLRVQPGGSIPAGIPLPPPQPSQSHSPKPHFSHHPPIPPDLDQLLDEFEKSDLAHIDPDKILSELPPQVAAAVKRQMEEFERNPEKLYQSVMELFK